MKRTAVVLTMRRDRVLAVSRPDPPLRFGLPGGGVDPGETPADAAIRELQEESGLHAPVLFPILEARRGRKCVSTFWAPEVEGRLRSSAEGVAGWVSLSVVLEGPYGEHALAAVSALQKGGYVKNGRDGSWLKSKMARIYLSAGRQTIARRRLERKRPHAFRADLQGDRGMWVLVHPSTKTEGRWQATFFDVEDEPIGDAENDDWAALLEHIHGDSVDWHSAERLR